MKVMLTNENGHSETEGPFQDLHLYYGVSVSDGENENVFSTVEGKM
jgi:hypothetical protein